MRFKSIPLVILLFSCFAACRAEGRYALVNASNVFLREEARYGSECVSQSRMGTLVEVLEQQGYWVRVRTPEPYEGWINELALAPVKALDAAQQASMHEFSPKLQPFGEKEAQRWLKADKYICTAEYSHVFSEPSEESERLSDFLMSDLVKAAETSDASAGGKQSGAGLAESGAEWLPVTLADGRPGWVRSRDVRPFREWAEDYCWHRLNSGEDISDSIISLAKRFLGMPYMWGGMSVGHFDCSGLTGFCYFMNGILLPRDASQQVKCGIEVPRNRMRPGDLVFFGDSRVSHVAIYIGDGRIIHSSQVVRINSLKPSEPDYYGRNILAVRRILGHLDEGSDGFKAITIIDSPKYF